MMLTQLADVARSAGLKVIEVDGWKTRTNAGESMAAVRTITCHHTANGGAAGNAPSLNVVQHGRPGLTGPLAHYLLARDGTVYVVAAGHCNHAGASWSTAETNSYAVGIEAEAVGVPGTAGDWPEVQMVAYARLCRALMAEFDLPIDRVLGHKETCAPAGRKSDPDFNMNAFRARVAGADLTAKVDDVSFKDEHKLTAADVKALGGGKIGELVSYDEIVRFPPAVARLRRETAAQFGALNGLIGQLLKLVEQGGTLTEAQAQAAAEAGANAALAELGDALTPDSGA
jgi:N-acetyl-anhydromuramyl-L-alanine amidase AmpD